MLFNRKPASSQFDKIGWVLVFWGLPIDIFTKKKRNYIKGFVSKMWMISSLILKTIIFTVSLVYTEIYSTIQRAIFFLFIIGGYSLNFSLLLKRKSIEEAVSNIRRLTLKLKPGETIGSKWINRILFAYSSYLVIMTLPLAYEVIMIIKNNTLLGEPNPDIAKYALWFCSFLNGIYAHGIYGITLILCSCTYAALGDIVRYERDILKENKNSQTLRLSDFNEEIQALREISRAVLKSDNALSHCTLQLYAVLFCVFLSATGGVISKKESDKLTPSYGMYIPLFNFLFYKLTMAASMVSEEGSRLKADCLKYSDSVRQGDTSMKLNKLIFLSNVNELKLYVTGGHMFVIDRRLFMTIGSAVITYGLVLYQI